MNRRSETKLFAAVLCLVIQTGVAFAQSGDSGKSPVQNTWVMKPTRTGHTLPLYQIKDQYVTRGFKEAERVKRPSRLENLGPVDKQFTDRAIQQVNGPQVGITEGLSIDGIGEGLTGPNGTYSVESVPPDTDVAVGTTQVVSLDNAAFAVFDKTSGAVTAGPYNTNALWNALGTGAICDTENDGDGIVKFDQLAQRWIITQFALGATRTGPFADCVAISQTADATGSWTVFQFVPSASGYFPDYPKLAVWPNVYSMTFDLFNSAGTAYKGAGICGIDRNALLTGNNPTIVCAQLTANDYALLPVDLDGSTYPASGAKALYIEQDSVNVPSTNLYMYRAAYNFTAGTVTVDPQITITVSSYNSEVCGSSTTYCVPQQTHTGALPSGETFSSEAELDTLEFHLMWRAAYRNFGSYESITLSHTVLGSGSNSGERWYEIRTPFGTPTVYQQSTYSPDTSLYRWMGSIAQDHQGDMALGYSGSSSTVFPSVYVTGRLNTDTINSMESETQLYAGLNSQVELEGYSAIVGERWGDYTSMMIDPNDCTFWYTGEYLKQAGSFNWSTRLLSFSFPSCTSTAAITMPVPSATLSGNSATFLWTASTGATGYWLDVGTAEYGNTIYQSGTLSNTVFSQTVSGLPTDGSTVYATLYTISNGMKVYNEYTYTAFNAAAAAAAMQSPTPGSTLTANSVTFTWNAGKNVSAYWMDVGNVAGGNQWYQSGSITILSATVPNGRPNGNPMYVTLYSLGGGQWVSNPSMYYAAPGAVMQTPGAGFNSERHQCNIRVERRQRYSV